MTYKALAVRNVLGSLLIASTSVAIAFGVWSIKANTWHQVYGGNGKWALPVAANAVAMALEVVLYICRTVWPRQYRVMLDPFVFSIFIPLGVAAAHPVFKDWRDMSHAYCPSNGETYRIFFNDKTYDITERMCNTMEAFSITNLIPLAIAGCIFFLSWGVIIYRCKTVPSQKRANVTWVAPVSDAKRDSDIENHTAGEARESRDSISIYKESL